MKKRHTRSNHYKAALSKIFLFGLLMGINANLGSCTSQQLISAPKHLYYVNGNLGSDTNPGSQALPWQTLQKAAGTLSAGDTVTVVAGNYPERVLISRSGKFEAPITFQTEGIVTIKGFTVNADYITIENFEISDTEDNSTSGWGIYVQGGNCTIEGNYIHDATRGGILIDAIAGSEVLSTDCIIQNNRLYYNSQVGIEIHGRNHIIQGNEIWGTIQYHPKWISPPAWVDADGIRFFGSGHIFRGNYIHDISIDDPQNINPHVDAFQTWDDEQGEVGSDIIFEQNRIILGQKAAGFQIEGGAHNLIIRNNIVNAFAGILTYQNGQSPYSSPSDIFVLNNAFIGGLTYSLAENPFGLLIGDTTNAVIQNNLILEQHGQAIEIYSSTADVDFNLFYNSDGSTPLGTQNINDIWNVDPLFIDPETGNFQLRAESPAIDTGTPLQMVTHDFKGILRPQGGRFDIGPYEYEHSQ